MESIGERLRWAVDRWNPTGEVRPSVAAFSREMTARGVKGGTSVPSIYAYFRGDVHPTVDFVSVAARVLGVMPAWLAFGEGPRHPSTHQSPESTIIRDKILTVIDLYTTQRFGARGREGIAALTRSLHDVFWRAMGNPDDPTVQVNSVAEIPKAATDFARRVVPMMFAPLEGANIRTMSNGALSAYMDHVRTAIEHAYRDDVAGNRTAAPQPPVEAVDLTLDPMAVALFGKERVREVKESEQRWSGRGVMSSLAGAEPQKEGGE